MTGLFFKKYHVAIYGENENFIKRISDALRLWYNNRVVIQVYTNSKHMFDDVNICSAKNNPFDLAIFGPDELCKSKQMILKYSFPDLPTLLFKDEEELQKDTSKFLL